MGAAARPIVHVKQCRRYNGVLVYPEKWGLILMYVHVPHLPRPGLTREVMSNQQRKSPTCRDSLDRRHGVFYDQVSVASASAAIPSAQLFFWGFEQRAFVAVASVDIIVGVNSQNSGQWRGC